MFIVGKTYLKSFCISQCLVFALALFSALTPTEVMADREKLVFIFQKQKDPEQVKASALEVAKYLSKEIGVEVEARVPSDYSASVQALVSKKADFAYTSSLSYLLAKRDGGAELLLAEQRPDAAGVERTEYDSVFVVAKNSPLKSFDDIVSKAKDLRMVFTSPTSTSGYVFAYARMVKERLLKPRQDPKEVFKRVQFAGSYSRALEEVAAGRGDVCAVSYYSIEGPSAEKYVSKNTIERLRIISRTPGVPTHLVSARAGLSPEIKHKVEEALLKLSAERPELLEDVYGTSKLVRTEGDQHVQKTVEAVKYLGIPVDGFVTESSTTKPAS